MNQAYVQWWLASLGTVLVWARMTVTEHGTASVFDCDGNTLTYDSEDSARAALLDADFHAWDGLDEDDAAQLGIDLSTHAPPQADNDADLRERMMEKRPRTQ
ncbi:hypothetical protein [Pseudomarimonas arenosa]|uniref:Uncharacterized protein n=1 Tax=Pseudomarimonas arenosa TaxID=2774145 RepID=A0AAW3ZN13_9GAMM|nr:hypothetical protein [Pseudomarimonas arenosa]MBD8527538.1 hypothetical protein [Pseudomarimonas arenosa]